MLRMRNWLIASLAASVAGCAATGDFCTVVTGPLEFAPGTADEIVRTDRPTAEAISVQNSWGAAHCVGWRRGGE